MNPYLDICLCFGLKTNVYNTYQWDTYTWIYVYYALSHQYYGMQTFLVLIGLWCSHCTMLYTYISLTYVCISLHLHVYHDTMYNEKVTNDSDTLTIMSWPWLYQVFTVCNFTLPSTQLNYVLITNALNEVATYGDSMH